MGKEYLSEIRIAEEFLRVAKDNALSSIRTSANRLYFALEKAVVAYLIFKGKEIPKNHQKLWEMAAAELGNEFYADLRLLYDLRMQADYGLMSQITVLTKDALEKSIQKVEFLIKQITSRIVLEEKKSAAHNEDEKGG